MKIARLDLWLDPVFDDRMRGEADVQLDIARLAGPPEATWAILEAAHVYQISAARNEVPAQWQANAELLRRCPHLLVVSSAGAGYDTVDVEACTRSGVLVLNQAGGNANSVAEMALGLMLSVMRRIVESDTLLKAATPIDRESLMGTELNGKTLGLVGIGHCGTRVAKLAGAFGMRVLAHDPLLEPDEIRRRGAEPVDLDGLLAQSDVVSLHCPLDRHTRGLMSLERMRRMKRGAVLISTARGGIHDETALATVLQEKHLAGAGLDVWEPEPPAPDHPLLRMPNVVATYHTAGVTREARRNVARMAAEQVLDVMRGGTPPRLVNPQAWPAFRRRWAEAFPGR